MALLPFSPLKWPFHAAFGLRRVFARSGARRRSGACWAAFRARKKDADYSDVPKPKLFEKTGHFRRPVPAESARFPAEIAGFFDVSRFCPCLSRIYQICCLRTMENRFSNLKPGSSSKRKLTGISPASMMLFVGYDPKQCFSLTSVIDISS